MNSAAGLEGAAAEADTLLVAESLLKGGQADLGPLSRCREGFGAAAPQTGES